MQTLDFLRQLACNNNREWFAAHRTDYEAALGEAERLAEQVIAGIREFDGSIEAAAPKQCMFRIYRDTRFAHDKTPYKTNFGFCIQRGGKKSAFAGYYLHLEAGHCFVCGGAWNPPPPVLLALRNAIQERVGEFRGTLEQKGFKQYFGALAEEDDKLTIVPRGFDKNSPAADYLKLKRYFAIRYFADADLEDMAFVPQTLEVFKAAYPLVRFLNEVIENM